MKKKAALVVVGVAIVVTALFFIVPNEEEYPPTPQIYKPETTVYDVATVQKGDLVDTLTLRCEYTAIMEESLSFDINGIKIENVNVVTGDLVKKGDVLVELDTEQLKDDLIEGEYVLQSLFLKREQLIETKNQEYNAHLRYLATLSAEQQATTLTAEEKVLYHQLEIDSLSDAIYIQELKISDIKKQIAARQLIAEFDGLVSYVRKINDGDYSKKDQILITLSDNESSAFIAQSDVKNLFEVGDTAEMVIDDISYNVTAISADEYNIESDDDEATYYFSLSDSQPVVSDGDDGKINVVLEERINVLYLPVDAIKYSDGQPAVYYQNDEGIRELKHVKTGLKVDKYIEIISGVTLGEQIIVG